MSTVPDIRVRPLDRLPGTCMTEQLQLILAGDFGRGLQTYDVEFDGRRKLDSPLLTRTGRNRVNEPVALRSAGPDPESDLPERLIRPELVVRASTAAPRKGGRR